MRQLASAICLAMTLFGAPAQAIETFTLRYAGTGFDPINCTQQGCPSTPWISTVTVKTVSGSDGVYSFNAFPHDNPANTLTFLSLVSDTLSAPFNLSTQDPSLNGILTATVQGGRVTSIDGVLFISPATWTFAGTVVDFNQPLVEKAGPFSGHAAVIPEPETYALMIVGLAAAAFGQRRRTTRTQRLASG